MTITANHNSHPRPVAPDAPDAVNDEFYNARRLFSGRSLAGPKQGENRLAGWRLENMDGLEDIFIVMGVEESQLLTAMNRVRGIVDIENYADRNRLEAIAEQVNHPEPHASQFKL